MKKCLKVVVKGFISEGFLKDFIQFHARDFSLEGSAGAAIAVAR